jgi:hypothetical protein
MKKITLFLTVGIGMYSQTLQCINITTKVANQGAQISQVIGKENIVSETDNIAGLKNALTTGVENAIKKLGTENGYFNEASVKIFLPNDAKKISENNIKLIPGGKELVEKTILCMNRSAEDAVKLAAPIFANAIAKMSFDDAKKILMGNDKAATEFFRKTTYTELKAAFMPKVKESLDKPLVANASTAHTWSLLTTKFNAVAKGPVGAVSGMKPVTTDLVNYTTDKTLEGLFLKLAEQEKVIRRNPAARVNEIQKKVFGQLD